MKKLTLALAATAAMAFAGTAVAEPLVEVVPSDVDPAVNVFNGTYTDADGQQGTQEGYVAVYADGAEACNGNQQIPGPRGDLQGYVWVGSGHASDAPIGQAPGGHAGAGNNSRDGDGDSPCPANG